MIFIAEENFRSSTTAREFRSRSSHFKLKKKAAHVAVYHIARNQSSAHFISSLMSDACFFPWSARFPHARQTSVPRSAIARICQLPPGTLWPVSSSQCVLVILAWLCTSLCTEKGVVSYVHQWSAGRSILAGWRMPTCSAGTDPRATRRARGHGDCRLDVQVVSVTLEIQVHIILLSWVSV